MFHTRLLVWAVFAGAAGADVVTYSGPLAATRAQFESYTRGVTTTEDFESFSVGDQVGDMPGNGARFAPEYADGSVSPLPVVIAAVDAPSGTLWMANAGNGRPAGSAWVIRPDNADDRIYAFGQANAQGDWVRIEGFDDLNNVVVTVDAQPIAAGCFAGFITPDGVTKVVVTPLGNADGFNGMDDVQVSTVPIEPCDVDINCDGYVNFFDIQGFIALYNAGDPDADLTGEGTLNFFDIARFIDRYLLGCG